MPVSPAPASPACRPPPATLLVVENHLPAAQTLCHCLENEGHAVDFAADGPAALHQLAREDHDLVLLDADLPGQNGYEVLKHLREQLQLPTPVLMTTARTGLAERLHGFACGADDVMVKPLALPEVAMRTRALLRRSRQLAEHAFALQHGPLRYVPAEQRVTVHGEAVALPRKCRMILELLLRYGERTLSRQTLEMQLWQGEPPSSNALGSHVHLLRKTLQRHGFSGIHTRHGVGWYLAPEKACPAAA